MATTFKWAATFTSRGSVLTTELNALGNGSYSAAGPAYDNSTNLDRRAAAEINLATLTPTTGATLTLFCLVSSDGTNYEDAPASTNPGWHIAAGSVTLTAAAGTKKVRVPEFDLPAGKVKFVLLNNANVALGATGNTVTLYTVNEQGV